MLKSLLFAGPPQGAVAVVIVAILAQPVCGQGGATMSAGQSMQNAANSAAGQANQNANGSTTPGGYLESETPPADPSGSYSGSEPYSGDYSSDYESGYESGSPGGAGRGRGGFAPGNIAGAVGGAFAGSLADFFNRPLSGAAAGFQPTVFEQAALAAHRGDQRLALALYHAHMLAERDSAAAALSSVRFSPLLRRPVWALRLGVSVNTKTPPALADDPQPIRDGEKKSNARGRNSDASGAEYGYESSTEETAGAQPPSARPSAGRAAARSRSSREPATVADGSLEETSSTAVLSAGSEGDSPEPQAVGLPLDSSGIETAQVEETLDRDLGLLADVLKAELTRRIRDGKFGPALAELTSQGADLAAKIPARSGGSGALPMWIPGVEFVGSGIATQMIEKARTQQVDLLVHFEVIAREIPRSEEIQYMARCRVVNVATGDTLGASKLLDRREVTLAARRSSVRAVVEELLRPAFDALDSKGSVTAMPALAPQHAMTRIDSLLAGQHAGRMSNLAEMAMFYHLGLIDQDQLQQVVYYAAGDEGLRLMHADYEQRRELANQMVARELGQN